MPTINLNKKEPQKRKTNNKSERRRERQKYYNTPAWKSLAKWYKMKYPLCEVCASKGITTPAQAVHHLDSPFRDGLSEEEKWDKLLDLDNLQSICVECHLKAHGLIDERIEKYKSDD